MQKQSHNPSGTLDLGLPASVASGFSKIRNVAASIRKISSSVEARDWPSSPRIGTCRRRHWLCSPRSSGPKSAARPQTFPHKVVKKSGALDADSLRSEVFTHRASEECNLKRLRNTKRTGIDTERHAFMNLHTLLPCTPTTHNSPKNTRSSGMSPLDNFLPHDSVCILPEVTAHLYQPRDTGPGQLRKLTGKIKSSWFAARETWQLKAAVAPPKQIVRGWPWLLVSRMMMPSSFKTWIVSNMHGPTKNQESLECKKIRAFCILKKYKFRWYPQQPQRFIFPNLSEACCEAKRWKFCPDLALRQRFPEPSPEPCWTWPGSAPKPPRPEPSPEPSPEP